ncbi:MAG: hypothetical protein R6X34_19615, partial [Chloroflexota bacterium]
MEKEAHSFHKLEIAKTAKGVGLIIIGETVNRMAAGLQKLFQHTGDKQVPGENIEDEVQGAEIIFKQFLFFLHHGRLPWWGATRETTVLRKAVSRFTPAQWRQLGQA